MKLSPGFWVISTTMRSESTFVPPVTELRSPPLSRITGALSPVIARLVDAGDAVDDVAVTGDRCRRPRTTTRSPWLQLRCRHRLLGAGPKSVAGRPGARAMVSVLARRSASAWALPRPSATASARLANSTVSHSQTTISQANTDGLRDREHGREHRADLDDEHHRVLATACAGSSLRRRPGATSRASSGRAGRLDPARHAAAGRTAVAAPSRFEVMVISAGLPRAAPARERGSR